MDTKKFGVSFPLFLFVLLCLLLCACQAGNAANAEPKNSTAVLEGEPLTWQGESRDDGWRCEGACIGADGISCDGFLVRITSADGAFFQEITLSAESRTMPTGAVHWEDVNFDGAFDVLVHLGGFREETAYGKIGNPIPDSEHRIIWDGTDTSNQFVLSAWEYLDGELMKTHQLSVAYDSSSEKPSVSYIEYALERGVWTEVQQMVWNQDEFRDVGAYISTCAVWENWKWCDVQRFQQKG